MRKKITMGRSVSIPSGLKISAMQYAVLEKISTRHLTGQQISKRAKILLLASKKTPHCVIHRELKVSINTVKSWRRRWEKIEAELFELETEKEIESALLLFLKDRPRPGQPRKFTEVQRNQIVALACDKPTNHGLEMTDWTFEMLSLTAQAKGIVEKISKSQVRQILKKSALTTSQK